MAKFAIKICLLFIFGFIKGISSEYNESRSEEYEAQDNNSSLNSESYETFNISSKENRIDSEDVSEMEKETTVNNIPATDKSPILTSGSRELKSKTSKSTIQSAEIGKENSVSKELNQTLNKKSPVHYPFSVSILKKSSHYTSGALVDKQWVLTSAAEFFNVRESIKVFRARLGSINCKRGGTLIPIKEVEIHPSYVQNRPGFDVALLKLALPVVYDQFIAPISISKMTGKVVSAKFLATYWPRLIVKGQVLPPSAKERVKQNSMRVSTQRLIPWDKCQKIIERNNVTLERSTLCLEPIVSHHTPCMPDPGAPVLAKDGLWGPTSGWTPKRCSSASATVFTRLSSPKVHSWLQLLLVDVL